MADVKITFKDGTVREFKERGRAGGSYTVTLSYEGAFVVVKDEWDERTAFPAADVKEVVSTPRARW